MKTLEQLQVVVNEVREVCERHGVILIGGSMTEDVWGEIYIVQPGDAAYPIVKLRIDNKVSVVDREAFTHGIG